MDELSSCEIGNNITLSHKLPSSNFTLRMDISKLFEVNLVSHDKDRIFFVFFLASLHSKNRKMISTAAFNVTPILAKTGYVEILGKSFQENKQNLNNKT